MRNLIVVGLLLALIMPTLALGQKEESRCREAAAFAETGRKEIAAWELGLLLEGIDLSKGQRRKRYSLPETTTLQENQLIDEYLDLARLSFSVCLDSHHTLRRILLLLGSWATFPRRDFWTAVRGCALSGQIRTRNGSVKAEQLILPSLYTLLLG